MPPPEEGSPLDSFAAVGQQEKMETAQCSRCRAVLPMSAALYAGDATVVCARCAATEDHAPDFTGARSGVVAAYVGLGFAIASWLVDPMRGVGALALILSTYALISMGKPSLQRRPRLALFCAVNGLVIGLVHLAAVLGLSRLIHEYLEHLE